VGAAEIDLAEVAHMNASAARSFSHAASRVLAASIVAKRRAA
jgi:hypothetical protein